MSDKAVIDATTGAWLKGPYCEADVYVPGVGEAIIEVAEGWPDKLEWSPAARVFLSPRVRRFSSLGFLALFTLEEQLAAYSNDDVRVRLTLGTTQSADFVDLDDPRVMDGLDLFVAVGLLSPARADMILTGETPE